MHVRPQESQSISLEHAPHSTGLRLPLTRPAQCSAAGRFPWLLLSQLQVKHIPGPTGWVGSKVLSLQRPPVAWNSVPVCGSYSTFQSHLQQGCCLFSSPRPLFKRENIKSISPLCVLYQQIAAPPPAFIPLCPMSSYVCLIFYCRLLIFFLSLEIPVTVYDWQ